MSSILKLSARQIQALRAMPMQADKETCQALGLSQQRLCNVLASLSKRRLIDGIQARSSRGLRCRSWSVTPTGQRILARIEQKEGAK